MRENQTMDSRDARDGRRAAFAYAEQLILEIGQCLRQAVPERYDTEAAPHLQTILDHVRRLIALLPAPS